MVFPNAIVISTLHARNVFASFVSRDSTYDLLVGIWKISHPNLKSSANGVSLDDSRGADKTVKVEQSDSSEGSGDDNEDEDDEMYDEDEEGGDGSRSLMTAGDGSHIGSEAGDVAQNGNRKPSGLSSGNGAASSPANGDARGSAGSPGAAPQGGGFPGPPTHGPTNCSDSATHYDKIIKDEVIAAPLGKVYSMVFGPASGAFMTKWLTEDQKVLELQMEDDKKGISDDIKTRTYSYIKPLNASIGPKQTKCLITETVEAFDLEKAVSVLVTTQTPDVPSGNVFSAKTKYCLTWAEGNATRMLINCTIEWTGKSWLKGMFLWIVLMPELLTFHEAQLKRVQTTANSATQRISLMLYVLASLLEVAQGLVGPRARRKVVAERARQTLPIGQNLPEEEQKALVLFRRVLGYPGARLSPFVVYWSQSSTS